MRRAGTIPYGWITDATRRGYFTPTYTGVSDFLLRHQAAYRADLWADADIYIEVWCESRSIAGMIQGTCKELAVSLYPAGGFSSITFAHEAAEYINEVTERGMVDANVIYRGDYDPAGVLIDQDVEAKLREHIDSHIELNFHRLAITPEQIIEYDLPIIERIALPSPPGSGSS